MRHIPYGIAVMAVLILVSLFLLNFKIIIVDGPSMQPTYDDKQILLARKYGQAQINDSVQRNDIIVFKKEGQLMIKRVVGISGDFIELSNGHISRNGVLISPYTYSGEDRDYQLNENEYFVIGDNHQNSMDSREYGAIHSEQILGTIVF